MSHIIQDLSSLTAENTNSSQAHVSVKNYLFLFVCFSVALFPAWVVSSLSCINQYSDKGSRGLCKFLNRSFSLSPSPSPPVFPFFPLLPKKILATLASQKPYIYFLHSGRPPGFVWVFLPPTEDCLQMAGQNGAIRIALFVFPSLRIPSDRYPILWKYCLPIL